MKNIILSLLGLALVIVINSCEEMMGDFLEKAPGVDVTEDTIFSNRTQVETFITAMYRQGIHSTLPRRENNYTGSRYGPISAACDEAESGQTWPDEQGWNVGDVTQENILDREERRLYIRWRAIRQANILINRIDNVPGLDATYIRQVKGEANFIIALNYFEMFKRYGGVPIVDKKFELTDEFMIPRSSIKELVDYIVKKCDEAIAVLPNAYTSDMRGRATKGAALALKSRTLLYAASPLFNTATPYLSMNDPNDNKLLCYGNYDRERWKLAADAAKALIDWAPQGGIALINDKGVDNNYRFITEVCDNQETILACKMQGAVTWTQTGPWQLMMPRPMYSGHWGVGNTMTFNFLRKYEKRDGEPQTWNMNGGDDLIAKYNELDRRFVQTVAHVGSYWNVDIPIVNSYEGGNHNTGNVGGNWVMKFIPRSMTNANRNAMANDIIFRLGEAYLNYAEALNEYSGPTAEAYNAVNIIRERSGQPPLKPGLSQAEFREKVRNERAIELYFEDHRFWDIRRWLIAEQDGVMQGDFYGIRAYQNPTHPNYRYEIYKFETRVFNKRMYLHPFFRDEVLKGYLVQNPGY